MPKGVVNKMIKEDPVGLIRLTIKYFKGKASVSHIKNRLISALYHRRNGASGGQAQKNYSKRIHI